jgi:hypothetical protein
VYGCFDVRISMGQEVSCAETLTESVLKHLALRKN